MSRFKPKSIYEFIDYDSKGGYVIEYSIPELDPEAAARIKEWEEAWGNIASEVSFEALRGELGTDLQIMRRSFKENLPQYRMSAYKSLPDNILERLRSVKLSDNEKMDKLTLMFDNSDLAMFKAPDFKDFQDIVMHGTVFRAKIGYDDLLSNWQHFKVLNFDGLREAIINAYELAPSKFVKVGMPVSFSERQAEFASMSLKEIVTEVARHIFRISSPRNDGSYNDDFLDDHIDIEELVELDGQPVRPITLDYDSQMTVLCFLQNLADNYGYQVWLEDESVTDNQHYILYFKPRDFLRQSTWKFNYEVDIDPEQAVRSKFAALDGSSVDVVYGGPILKSDAPSSDTRDKLIYTKAEEIDPVTGKVVTTRFRYSDPYYTQTGEESFMIRHLQDIHGAGNKGSLGEAFIDLNFVYYERKSDEGNSIPLGRLDEKTQQEVNKLFRFSDAFVQVVSSIRFPTERELDTIGKTHQVDLIAQISDLDEDVYDKEWQFLGDFQKSLRLKAASFRQQAYLLEKSAHIDFLTETSEKSDRIITDNGKELWGRLFGKRFRELSSTMSLRFTVVGNPQIKSRQVCELIGTGAYDTKWYIIEANHNIDNNGYETEILCISNSTLFDGKNLRPEAHPAGLIKKIKEWKKVSDEFDVEDQIVTDCKTARESFIKKAEGLWLYIEHLSTVNKAEFSVAGAQEFRRIKELLLEKRQEYFDIIARFNRQCGERYHLKIILPCASVESEFTEEELNLIANDFPVETYKELYEYNTTSVATIKKIFYEDLFCNDFRTTSYSHVVKQPGDTQASSQVEDHQFDCGKIFEESLAQATQEDYIKGQYDWNRQIWIGGAPTATELANGIGWLEPEARDRTAHITRRAGITQNAQDAFFQIFKDTLEAHVHNHLIVEDRNLEVIGVDNLTDNDIKRYVSCYITGLVLATRGKHNNKADSLTRGPFSSINFFAQHIVACGQSAGNAPTGVTQLGQSQRETTASMNFGAAKEYFRQVYNADKGIAFKFTDFFPNDDVIKIQSDQETFDKIFVNVLKRGNERNIALEYERLLAEDVVAGNLSGNRIRDIVIRSVDGGESH